jgi:hypothetical protein
VWFKCLAKCKALSSNSSTAKRKGWGGIFSHHNPAKCCFSPLTSEETEKTVTLGHRRAGAGAARTPLTPRTVCGFPFHLPISRTSPTAPHQICFPSGFPCGITHTLSWCKVFGKQLSCAQPLPPSSFTFSPPPKQL